MNDKVYIHEFIEIRGHRRADYMHHMTANWSPLGQETRNQRCFGVWATLGSTGRWPQVVNLWEEDGFPGLARSFAGEAVGAGAQDPQLAKWWAKAAEFRRGGFDRLLRPAPWMKTIDELCADRAAGGACYAHEQFGVRPGANWELLDRARTDAAAAYEPFGLQLIGAFVTAMVDDDECFLLWAVPSWEQWGAFEDAHGSDDGLTAWQRSTADIVTSRHRILLVDAPLSPLRTGRQPARSDRTDWVD